jgi:hypothetical protein
VGGVKSKMRMQREEEGIGKEGDKFGFCVFTFIIKECTFRNPSYQIFSSFSKEKNLIL